MSALAATPRWREPSVVPGFGLAFGITLAALGAIVLAPLAALALRAADVGPAGIAAILADARVQHALMLSFGTALAAASIDALFGLVVAWVLVRYRFPGRRLLDAMVDLPFALPTAVAGIALAALYAPGGWIGAWLVPLGIEVAFTPLGILVALVFVGLPFVVRTLQPLIADLDREVEEASATLGASRFDTLIRVVLPVLLPALMTGFALALARTLGEYGSVIFIAGNLPRVSEIAPLLIVIRLEEFDYAGATAIALVMLVLSFTLLLGINAGNAALRRMLGHGGR